jgi:excinuclease ABC subunit C
VRKLKAAQVDEIAALPGFGPRTAAAVLAALNGADAAPVTTP